MKLLIFLTALAGIAVGLLWPPQDHGGGSSPGWAREVVLHRSSDRHFYAEAKINGKSIRFLVDTGSSAVALTPEDARKLGIAVSPAEYELLGQGASGIVRGKYVEVDSIEVGGISQEDVEVAVVEGASISLLGQPFLEELDEIVIRKDVMLLRSASGS